MTLLWLGITPPFFGSRYLCSAQGSALGVKKYLCPGKFHSCLVETFNVKPLLFHFSVSLGWKVFWQHSSMTEASEGAVRHTLTVQARAHSEFLLPSGTANPTSTSALCSCFCSSVGQSKRVPAKASASNLSPLTNHPSSSISMLRMG